MSTINTTNMLPWMVVHSSQSNSRNNCIFKASILSPLVYAFSLVIACLGHPLLSGQEFA